MKSMIKVFYLLSLITLTINSYAATPNVNMPLPQEKNLPLVISGSANKNLANDIAQYIGTTLCKTEIGHYNDGEINIHIKENVRNKDVFVVQSTCKTSDASINDNMMELMLLVRTLKRASTNGAIGDVKEQSIMWLQKDIINNTSS
jgi:hypothetical protein